MTLAPPANDRGIERQVLEIVAELVAELAAGPVGTPALDDSLERDLGIGSLERVELLLRLEKAFGVRLPDPVMAEAATPSALVAAVRGAGPPHLDAAPGSPKPAAPAVMAPRSAQTLVDVLRWHADRSPARIHVHLRNDDGTNTPITFGELLNTASAVGAGLRSLGVVRGDRVALVLRTEPAFFGAFLGTLTVGAIPVPLYPPVRADELLQYARRQQAILRNAGARVLVTFAEAERIGTLLRGQVPSLETVATVDHLVRLNGSAGSERPAPDDPALIQYTSGSTGDPKGVLLTHANILANIRAIGDALAIGPDDVSVSWLPLYHDMGLIGMWLGSLCLDVPLALMSPLAFLSRPARWLWTIHAHRGTISAAPNFAFDLSAGKIADEELQGLDLGSWRIALNGSEMVSAETIDRFTRRFAPYGFKAETMCPAFGLAEASVALTLPSSGRAPRIDPIAREPFERARELRPASGDDPRPLRFVSCGRPLRDHEVRIADRSGRPVGERTEGAIHFRGPSVTHGYFRNPEATREVVRDGWTASGDLGYCAEGELFITGRAKDLIIQSGRNISAEEAERIAARVPGIRKGCVAAFGVHDPSAGTERFVIVAETRERDPDKREALRRAVCDRVVDLMGTPPDVVVIADPRTVLKTPNGKIRRGAIRVAYLEGTLGRRQSAARQWSALLLADAGARTRRLSQWLGHVAFNGYVWLVLVTTLPVLWAYLLLRPPGRHADRAAKRWSRLALALGGFRLRVTGSENLNGLRSGILVANHASYIDSVVMMAAIPLEFHFIAKRQLADYPLIGTVIGKAGHRTIERGDVAKRLAGAEQVATLLRDGELILIFPEGTFRRSAGLLPFRLGAFRAAVDAGHPIVPVSIRGTRQALPDGTWMLRRARIEVTIGAPLTPQATGWPEMVRLRDLARDEIARGSGEPPLAQQ